VIGNGVLKLLGALGVTFAKFISLLCWNCYETFSTPITEGNSSVWRWMEAMVLECWTVSNFL